MEKRLQWLFLLAVALCALASLSGVHAASTASKTFSDNQTYVLEGQNYIVHPQSVNATLLQRPDGTKTIVKKNACLTLEYTTSCLTSTSATSATFTETFTGPVLTNRLELETRATHVGELVKGTVTLTNTGEDTARNVLVRIPVPDGWEIPGDEDAREYQWEGNIIEDSEARFTFEPRTNGTATILGTVSYWDGNTTKALEIKNQTVAVTRPIGFSVKYNNTTSEKTDTLAVKVTRKNSLDYTVTLTATFPDEAQLLGKSTGTSIVGQVASVSRFLNYTEMSMNVTYGFIAPPSDPLLLAIRYRNSTADETFEIEYPFEVVEDENEPSLAVGVDPLTENRTGTLRIIITGNRTGLLLINGSVLNLSLSAKPDTYEFAVPPLQAGEYSLKVSFMSLDRYSNEHVAKGTVQLSVKKPAAAPPSASNNSTNASTGAGPGASGTGATDAAGDKTGDPALTAEQARTAQRVVWTVAAAALILLVVLLLLVRRFRDPLARIERMTERVSTLRKRLEAKGALGKTQSKEYQELERLERELGSLQKKL